jgi:hypothetical protein
MAGLECWNSGKYCIGQRAKSKANPISLTLCPEPYALSPLFSTSCGIYVKLNYGGGTMRMFRNGRVVIGFSIALFFLINFLGCATSSRIQALEEKIQLNSEKVEQALKECQGAKEAVEDSSRYSAEAAANAQRAEAAASRAETSALQAKKAARAAESSAIRAEDSANKAENSTRKTTDIYDRIIAK